MLIAACNLCWDEEGLNNKINRLSGGASVLQLGFIGRSFMGLKAKQLRKILRWVHIMLGVVLMCYIYSPFHKYLFFQLLIKILVVPVITLTGVWVWKFKKINDMLGIH